MTREEAIKIFQDKIKTMEDGAICCNYGIDKDAFTLVIQLLKEESCEDAISRQAVLDGLANIAKATARSDAQKALMGRVMFFTKNLPPVNPQETVSEFADRCRECGAHYGRLLNQKWTPIKTRHLTNKEKEEYADLGYSEDSIDSMYDCPLPEDGEEVLITTRYDEVTTDTFYRDAGCYFETYCDKDDVKAWMPFKPYKA